MHGSAWLADLAYQSVPHMLPPFKGEQTMDEEPFSRVHEFYRARAEKIFAPPHTFEIGASHYRGDCMQLQGRCIRVLCAVVNIDCALTPQNVPYSPIPENWRDGLCMHFLIW